MALFKFTKAILEGTPIDVYNEGRMQRDFTFVDDIVSAIVRVVEQIPVANSDWNSMEPDPGTSSAPFRIYNIGNHQPTELLHFIQVIEDALGMTAKKNMLPMQPGDVPATFADVQALVDAVGFSPSTPIEIGIPKFIDWYRGYYSNASGRVKATG